MFSTKGTKKTPHPLDTAIHSTQQYDSPEANTAAQQARAQPTKQEVRQQAMARTAEHPNEGLPHPSLKAEQQGGGGGAGAGVGASSGGYAPVPDKGASSNSSMLTRPVASTMNTTVSTIGNIVTLGGMLGGGKDENEWAKHASVETEDLPPLGVLRHEVAATLLGVVATHPAAAAARELCREVGQSVYCFFWKAQAHVCALCQCGCWMKRMRWRPRCWVWWSRTLLQLLHPSCAER